MKKVVLTDVKWFVGKSSIYNCSVKVYIDMGENNYKSAKYAVKNAIESLPFVVSVHSVGSSYTWRKDNKVLFQVLCTVSYFPARCEFFKPNFDGSEWLKEHIGEGYIVIDVDSQKATHEPILSGIEGLQVLK